jgi:hypothetical protein
MCFLLREATLLRQCVLRREWCEHCAVQGGGLDVIRKEAWPFYRTSPGVRLCWELEEPKGPEGWKTGADCHAHRACMYLFLFLYYPRDTQGYLTHKKTHHPKTLP